MVLPFCRCLDLVNKTACMAESKDCFWGNVTFADGSAEPGCLPSSLRNKTTAELLQAMVGYLNASEAVWGSCPESAFARKYEAVEAACYYGYDNEAACNSAASGDLACMWDSEYEACYTKWAPSYYLNLTNPTPFSTAFVKAKRECVDASSGGEAKCLAIGPAAPPEPELEANIAAAEVMNLTVVRSDSAGGIAAMSSDGKVFVAAMAVGFSILLLLTGF